MEHRWGTRVRVDVPVLLEAGSRCGLGFIRDVSLSGAYLKTSIRLSPGTRVFVQVERGPFLSSGPHRVHAHVIRAEESGLALEWSEFAPKLVRTLIAHAAYPGSSTSDHSVTAGTHAGAHRYIRGSN